MYRVARLAGLVILFAPFASGDDLFSTPHQRTSCTDGHCELPSLTVKLSGVNPGVRDSRPAPSHLRTSGRLTPSRRLFLRRPFRLFKRRRCCYEM